MLPKEEKVKLNSELDQPGLFDKENERDRIVKKRKFVYITMALTIGLSLSFWIYRSIKNSKFSFKLPQINFNLPTQKNKNIDPPSISLNWSVFLKNLTSDSIIFQTNQNLIFEKQNLDSIIDQIDQSNFIATSSYGFSLPLGLKLKEIVEEENNNFTYISKIFTPNQQLLLIFKINDSNLTEAKKSIPDLINQLYWYSLQK